MTKPPTEETRVKLKSALARGERVRRPAPSTAGVGSIRPRTGRPRVAAGFSIVDAVIDGVDGWWRRSSIGSAVQALAPFAEPHLKTFARRHYRAVLLGSVAAGALVSHFPGRSTRTVLKIAGPVVLASVMLEIIKAGVRQSKRTR